MASSRKSRPVSASRSELPALAASRLAEWVKPGTTVTVALSGGVDSIVMLDLLRALAPVHDFRVQALHVHHGLSPNAPAWETFCRSHCRRRGVAFHAIRVAVAGAGANVEAHARAARYRAFSACGFEYLALAHHRDDQAETLLLNLLRGSGVHGLGAMPAQRRLDAGAADNVVQVIRPLLEVSRSEILHYAKLRRLRWLDDESNREERFNRNFLRLRVLPLLQERFPGYARALARSAVLLGDAAELCDILAAIDGQDIVVGARLDAGRLDKLAPARAANVLRGYLARAGERPPSLARTREMLRQLGSARADSQPAIRLVSGELRRFRGWIELVQLRGQDVVQAPLSWRGQRRVRLADGSELHAVRAKSSGVSAQRLGGAPVTVRLRQGGECMRVEKGRKTRTLKNLLQEAAVAPWVRQKIPLLFCGDALVWAPFVGIAAEFVAAADEPAWQFRWEPAQKKMASLG